MHLLQKMRETQGGMAKEWLKSLKIFFSQLKKSRYKGFNFPHPKIKHKSKFSKLTMVADLKKIYQ